MDYDVLIVGGGPAGLYLSKLLKSFSVLVVEENSKIGIPVTCAGLVGKDLFDEFDISKKSIISKVSNAKIFSPDMESFTIGRKNIACVIDRERFDNDCFKGSSAELMLNTKFLGYDGAHAVLRREREKIYVKAQTIVGADGPFSKVRKVFRFNIRPQIYLGLQYVVEGRFDTDVVEIHFGEFSEDFFGWVIPVSEKMARVGFATKNKPERTMKLFLKRIQYRKILEKIGGAIPIGYGETAKESILLVGDAASQVKPTTGGGLYYALKCSEIAAEHIMRGDIAGYDKGWKRILGNEIKYGIIMRKIYEKISMDNVEKIFNFFKENAEYIEKKADYERHLEVFLSLLLRKNAPKLFIEMLKSFRNSI